MKEVTLILSAIERGNPQAAEQLLPLVYDELRRLAAQKLAREATGQTLQPTALVHDAYLRLVGTADPGWDSRGHFFAAAAEAMRRILVESARRKHRLKRGGGTARRVEGADVPGPERPDEMLAVDEALDRLAVESPQAAELIKLRFFAGLSNVEAAAALGVSPRKADGLWAYARAWMRVDFGGPGDG